MDRKILLYVPFFEDLPNSTTHNLTIQFISAISNYEKSLTIKCSTFSSKLCIYFKQFKNISFKLAME